MGQDLERNSWLKVLIALLAIIAAWYLIGEIWNFAGHFSDVILLFFLAWLLAFVLNPVANALRVVIRVPRIAAVALVYLGLVLAVFVSIVLMVPTVTDQLSQLGGALSTYSTEQLPEAVATVQSELWRRNISIDLTGFYQQGQLANQAERLATFLVQNGINILTGVASTMFAVVLVVVLSFYFMVDDGRLQKQVMGMVPIGARREAEYLLECVERSFGGFIRGQLIQCAIYGVGTAVIMLSAGLDYVLLSSLFAGGVMLIPFIGPLLAIGPPIIIAALQGSLTTVVIVGIALLAMQQIVINVVAPKVLSDSVGLPPLLVILALLVGAKLGGLVGALFGVPVAAVVYSMLIFLYQSSSSNDGGYRARESEDNVAEGARTKPSGTTDP